MPREKYNTIQQHEPLRVPESWTGQERRFVSQLEEILDDLYRRFGRIRLNDLNKELKGTVISSSEGIQLVSEDVEDILDGTKAVQKLNNSGVEITPAGVFITTTGVFTVASGNFEIDADGNVRIKNADVSGNLTSGGHSVLTKHDIIVSSNQPSTPKAGMVWLNPSGSTALTYNYGVNQSQSFQDFNTSHNLVCQSSVSSASGTYSYSLTIPYRVKTTSTLVDRTLTVVLKDPTTNHTLTLTHTITLTGTSSYWLCSGANIGFTMTLTASGTNTPYAYHDVETGSIQLVCSAGSGGSGWSTATVSVYQ